MISIIREEENEGFVSAIQKDTVWVTLSSSCSTGSDCAGGCCSCAGSAKARKAMVHTPIADSYSVGDHVRFRHYVPNESLVAITVFGIPIVFAFLMMLIWNANGGAQGAESPIAILSAVAAFLLGFAVVWVIDKIFRKLYPSKLLTAPSARAA